jgi:hypothetical protein
MEFNNKIYNEHKFAITRGVKQEGVISQLLFNIYVDEFINKIISSDFGLSIDNYNCSILAYCDDILILSPSLSSLQKILDICSDYGSDWNIKFNPLKSCIFQTGRKLYNDVHIKLVLNSFDVPVVSNGCAIMI